MKLSSPIVCIEQSLKAKYPDLKEQIITTKSITSSEIKALKTRNSEKVVHSQFFSYQNDPMICQRKWLRSGISSPSQEARNVFLQDRNVYYKGIPHCSFCNKPRTLEHVASSCTMRLAQYTARPNEVLKCIHRSQTVSMASPMINA